MPDKPLKVIHVITRLILGGAQENTIFTVEGLARMPEFSVKLISGPAIGPEGDLVRRAVRNGVDLEIMPELRRELHPWCDPAAFLKLCAVYRRERPDIVHTHSSKAGILGRAAARATGVPCVIHTIHGLPFHPYQSKLANAVYILSERIAARWSRGIISVADAMSEKAVAAGVAPPDRFITIYSGMEVDPFLAEDGARERIRSRFGVAPDEVVIGKIARLFELKGHVCVLDAAPAIMEKFPNVKLMFVGDGILRDSLQRRAETLGISDRLIFTGLVEPSEIPAMIKAMDVVVHASLREGLARVLPQSLLSARPVVTFDIDGAREVVIEGETGYLVEPGSIEGLADAIIRALSDMPRARAMAVEGRRRFADRFRAETMVSEIAEYYRRFLD